MNNPNNLFNITNSAQTYSYWYGGIGYYTLKVITLKHVGIIGTWSESSTHTGYYYKDSTYLIGMYCNGELLGDTILTFTAIKSDDIVDAVTTFSLSQKYPNPFNPRTMIEYSIPRTSFVTLKVYDILGKEIATLVNEEKTIGNYEVEFDGKNLPSGVYFYKFKVGDFIEIRKMVLLR